MRVSAASFGKHCISGAVISVTVCFVIATGSACSVDLEGRFNLLYSSKLDENAGSLCFGGSFYDDMVFVLSVSYSFSSCLHATVVIVLKIKCTDDYRVCIPLSCKPAPPLGGAGLQDLSCNTAVHLTNNNSYIIYHAVQLWRYSVVAAKRTAY